LGVWRGDYLVCSWRVRASASDLIKGIEAEASKYIEAAHGGKVIGSSKHPLGTSDLASFLLQAQGSKAQVIGLANAGGDTINAVKQAAEFGIQQGGQKLVAFLLFINDVHGMGLKVAQGLQIMERFTGT
jgi:branched-chain amino acid transport system substrate-binding protein